MTEAERDVLNKEFAILAEGESYDLLSNKLAAQLHRLICLADSMPRAKAKRLEPWWREVVIGEPRAAPQPPLASLN